MTEYTAVMAMPDGDMAREAASRIPGAEVTDEEGAGVWVVWTSENETDEEGIHALQEIRIRAEMFTGAKVSNHPPEDDFTLFQSTPLLILRGRTTVIHSEEVLCI